MREQISAGAALTAMKDGAPPAKGALPRHRVLVVDDTRDSAFVLGKLLENLGQQTFTAQSGARALELARSEAPDLVISDIAMPDIDGYELARRLRQEPALDRAMLVALTGHGHDEARELAIEAGFDQHLVKPISLTVLESLLAALPKPGPRPAAPR